MPMSSTSVRCAALASSALLLNACLGTHAPDPAPVVRGPLATRTQHPVSLTLLHFRPRRATVAEPGEWGAAVDFSYSSIYEVDTVPGESVRFDGETLRGAARLRYGLAPRTDVEVELAAVYATSGFLDQFIREFHDAFDLPQAGRDDTPDDQYDMSLRHDGALFYELEEDRVSFGDLPVVVTRQVRDEDREGPAVAVRFGVELPTGSEDRGASNGELDYGLGVLLERSVGRWTWTGAADVLLPGQPDAWDDAGVDVEPMAELQAGGEYRWSDRLSLLLQLNFTTHVTREFTVEEFDTAILDLGLGCSYDAFEGGRVDFALKEDVVAATGPDFGVYLGVSWGF